MSLRTSAITAFMASAAALTVSTASFGGEYDGITIHIMTRPGKVIAQPLIDRGVEFTKLTGAKVEVAEVPFAELFQKVQTDWTTGTNSVDVAVVTAGWVVELYGAGLIADLTPFVEKDTKLQLDDIAPYFRENNQKIQGKTVGLTIDGDFQMAYYRKDVLDAAGLQPPKTWDEYLEVAKALNGKDMNGDGTPDYGSCSFKKRNAQSYFAVQTIAAPYVQSKGTQEGIHFFSDTMKPKINNEAWKRAFEIYKETGKYGPPDEMNMDIGDTRALFKAGRCGLVIDWGDPGTLQYDPDSKIAGKLFSIGAVGSKEVLDPATGKLVPVTKENAPYSVDGINYAPFAAFGGWTGIINAKADPKAQKAAYDFLSYMSQPAQSNVDVTIGYTGYQPYRNQQFDNLDQWLKAGFSKEMVENYLGAIKSALNNPNMASDFKIPGAQQYTGVVLDRELARYLAGEITVEEALKNIEDGWEEITEDFGRDNQIKFLALQLGTTNK